AKRGARGARSALARRAVHRRGWPAGWQTRVRTVIWPGGPALRRGRFELSRAGAQIVEAFRAMAIRAAVIALFAAFAASACADAKPTTPAEPAVFAVRDADSTIYLYGTVHVRPNGSDWGGPIAHAALAASSDVWTEMEISPETDARGQQLA